MATTSKETTEVATRSGTSAQGRQPFIDLTDPARLVSRLFGDTLPHGLLGMSDRMIPGADLVETDEGFTVELELPGVAKKDITIDVTGRRVSVHGERMERERQGVLRHSTRASGRFDYEMTLPSAVDANEVTAVLDDGVLTVQLPKAKTERPHHIEIK